MTKRTLLQLLDSVQVEVEHVKEARESLSSFPSEIAPNRRAVSSDQRDDQARAKANPGRRRKLDIPAKVAAVAVPLPAGTTEDRKNGTLLHKFLH